MEETYKSIEDLVKARDLAVERYVDRIIFDEYSSSPKIYDSIIKGEEKI